MTTLLHELRLNTVLGVLRECGARTILDLGCGDGDLLIRLVGEPHVERIVGVDLALEALERLRERLRDVPEHARGKAEFVHGSMIEGAPALAGFDAALLIETIEHFDPERLSVLERAVFHDMHPATVVITTPNADFNPLLGVPGHRFRHPDHRFEWGRAKFRSWSEGVAKRNGYAVRHRDLAGGHPTYGGASQMALFHARTGVVGTG